MAFELSTTTTVVPEATLVVRYTPHRIGVYPIVDIDYAEVARQTETAVVQISNDENNDGIFEKAVLNINVNELLGAEVYSSSVCLGVVSALSGSENSIFLTTGSVNEMTGSLLTFKLQAVTNSPAWKVIGQEYTVRLDGSNDNAMAKIGELLGTAYIQAVMAVVQQASSSLTLEQVQTAIFTLAQQGVNLDTFLAQQAEKLEKDRRAGTVPYASVTFRG